MRVEVLHVQTQDNGVSFIFPFWWTKSCSALFVVLKKRKPSPLLMWFVQGHRQGAGCLKIIICSISSLYLSCFEQQLSFAELSEDVLMWAMSSLAGFRYLHLDNNHCNVTPTTNWRQILKKSVIFKKQFIFWWKTKIFHIYD